MPKIQESTVKNLHPTQLTIGLIVVADKKSKLLELNAADQRAFMQAHPMPVVVGPQGRLYITDHHHLGRAALEAGVTCGFFEVEDDLSKCRPDEFWEKMNDKQWVHPLDENGVRHLYAGIPDTLGKLVDDVYRSLAGYVRDANGYDKTPTAFAEFIWADFFRRNIAVETVRANFKSAVKQGIALAQGRLAKRIPGYNGK